MNLKKTVAILASCRYQAPLLSGPTNPWLFMHPDIQPGSNRLRVRKGDIWKVATSGGQPCRLNLSSWGWVRSQAFSDGKWSRYAAKLWKVPTEVYVMPNGWRLPKALDLWTATSIQPIGISDEIAYSSTINMPTLPKLMTPKPSMWKLERKSMIPLRWRLKRFSEGKHFTISPTNFPQQRHQALLKAVTARQIWN